MRGRSLGAIVAAFVGSLVLGLGAQQYFPPLDTLAGILTTSVDGIGVVSTDGLVIQNATNAAVGAQQWSPRLRMRGNAWGTNSGGQTNTIDFKLEVQPLQSGVPFALFSLDSSTAGAAYVNHFQSFYSGATPTFLAGGNIFASASTNASIGFNATPILSAGVVSWSSGFGASPAIVSGKVHDFRWNVGTGGSATTGVLAFGGTAAATGWNCDFYDLANAATNETVMTASTTTTVTLASFSRTAGTALAWPSAAVIGGACRGF